MQNFIAGNTKTQSIEDYIGKTNTSNLQATSEQGNDFARILGLDKDNSRNYTDRAHHEKNNTKTLYDTENKYEKTDRRDSKEKNAPRREDDTNPVKNNGAADYDDNSKTTVDKVDSKPVIKEAKETLEGANTEVLSADDAIKQTAEKIDNLIENSLTGQLDMADVEEIKNVLNEIKTKIDNGKLVVNEDTKQALNNIINRLLTQNPKDFEVDALIKDFKQLAQDIQANTFKTNSQVKLEEEASNPLKALEVNVNTEDTNTPEVKDKKIVNEEKNTLKTKEAQTNIQVNSEVKEVQKSDSASEKADIEQEMLEEMDVKIEEVSGSSTSSSDTSEKNFTTAQDEVIKLQIENAEADTSTPVTFAFDRSIKNANAANNQIRLEGITKELNTNDILNQIGSKFEQLKDGSSTKLTMTLRPNDLGRVTIELLSNANGISTNIIAQNSQVKELLDKNIDILKQQLAQQGINVQNIQVKTVEQNAQASLNNSFGDRGQGEQDTNNNRENKNSGSRQNDGNKHGEESYKFNQSNVIENIDFENNSRGATASINTLRGKISYNL